MVSQGYNVYRLQPKKLCISDQLNIIISIHFARFTVYKFLFYMGLSQNLHKKIIVMECHSCGLKTGKNKCTVWLQHNIKVTKWKAL